jgi:rare lipoprotein A (peptidoglycan hydrolase)
MYRTILSAFALAMLVTMQLAFSSQARAGGMASFYGYDFAGRPTASGETFNPGAMTAASLSLPFGTLVRVTNRNNGRSVVVRINDRGPYVGGRVIDLSLAAAGAIGMVGSGVAPVDMQIVGSGGGVMVASNSGKHHANVQVAARTSRRHHAAVQVAFLPVHHGRHHGILLASAKIRHHHTGTAIASGVSTHSVGFAAGDGNND